jgi:hypothetical protein
LKNLGRKNSIIGAIYILMIITILLVFSGCEPGTAISVVIENQTNQNLTICKPDIMNPNEIDYVTKIGYIEPNQQVSFNADWNSGNWTIIALNDHNEIVYSQVFSLTTNLKRINRTTYKGVIPPLE